MNHNNLSLRAISVLVHLRGGCRSLIHIRNAISDVSAQATMDLLGDLRESGLVTRYSPENWGLTADGQAWLETNSLRMSEEAKREMYAMYDNESRETRRLKPQKSPRMISG